MENEEKGEKERNESHINKHGVATNTERVQCLLCAVAEFNG